MLAQQSNNLAVSHPLIVKRVNRVQQLVNLLGVTSEQPHRIDQASELIFVQHTILVKIEPLKVLVELQQKPFMFTKLEIQNYFLEVRVQ